MKQTRQEERIRPTGGHGRRGRPLCLPLRYPNERATTGGCPYILGLACLAGAVVLLAGCKSAVEHRQQADTVAADIITAKQQEALGRTEPFSIERPSDILRRRLLIDQNLPYSSQASLGADQLPLIEHWPEPNYPYASGGADVNLLIEPNQPVRLKMVDALQVAAQNSNQYQNAKEGVFAAALALDLQRNDFRNIFSGGGSSGISSDRSGGTSVNRANNSGDLGVDRLFTSGLAVSSAIALDLTNLLTQGGASAAGLVGDGSLTLPLLRGAGRHIVTENLTQAERDVVYAMWDFERFKRTFCVSVASQYLSVLQQADELRNAEDDYRRAVRTARRSQRLTDAGRLPPVQLDQAVQDELRARNGWISAQERLKGTLDSFKRTLGLPTDAQIELERTDLDELAAPYLADVAEIAQAEDADPNAVNEETPPADAPVVLEPATRDGAGPFELDEAVAIDLALENRRDLQVANAEVEDAQRRVVVAADRLRSGLDLSAGANSWRAEDQFIRFDRGQYDALLSLDLPLERTAERNAYRQSLISLERATRTVQSLEDQIKGAIRDQLRTLLESRESLQIQVRSVALAERRVSMTSMLLEAGRTEIRDVLEAQAALLGARNSLTRAVVQYRVAELELQRDIGVLEVNERGLYREYSPEEVVYGKVN